MGCNPFTKLRNFLDKKFPKKCDICGGVAQVRYIEGRGKICFPCFYGTQSRAERRRIDKIVRRT
jgi:hypothetical protein